MKPSQFLILPRAVAHANRRVLLSSPRRSFTSSYNRRVADDDKASPFGSGPAPPRLPKEEQEIFERLQKESTGAFSTPRTPPKVNQSPDSTVSTSTTTTTTTTPKNNSNGRAEDELFPHMRERRLIKMHYTRILEEVSNPSLKERRIPRPGKSEDRRMSR